MARKPKYFQYHTRQPLRRKKHYNWWQRSPLIRKSLQRWSYEARFKMTVMFERQTSEVFKMTM